LGNGAALGDHLIKYLGLKTSVSDAANDGAANLAPTGTK
jgi:hypothetical protein